MELPGIGILKSLGERISRVGGNKVTIEEPLDPKLATARETLSKQMLVRFYTDPRSLQDLGALGVNMANFHRAGEELTRMEADLGINTNAVPHLTSNIKEETAKAADIIAQNREQALSLVSTDRRAVIDHEALLESQRLLNEKLKEEGLNRGYRVGATEMLRRIDDQLKERIALPVANPTVK